MLSLRHVFLLIFSLLSLSNTEADAIYAYCNNASTYSPNSTYQLTLNALLSTLASNATARNTGFYNTTVGLNPPNIIYGLFLCRGDLTTAVCKACVTTATEEVGKKYCTDEKEVFIWYDECMLRYSNQSFFSMMDEYPIKIVSLQNVTEPDRFNQLLAETLNELATRAANSDGKKYFATKEASFTRLQTLYSLAQCTPDLSPSNCNRCLSVAIATLLNRASGKQSARVLVPSCNVRYGLEPFYRVTVALPPALPPGFLPRDNQNSSRSRTVIIIVPTIILFALTALSCAYFLKVKPKKAAKSEDANSETDSFCFEFGTIRAATNDFSSANKLGEGGFGSVYKGRLSDGQEIAVKRLAQRSTQGELEFKNEIVLMARLQHRNLVRLLGFCSEGKERILIYECIPNGSLDHFIFDPIRRVHLGWERRYKIIGGIARGILYLHQDSRLKIIHRDLKAANVLLDGEMNPKIADFGTARLFVADQSQSNTRRIVGTHGYMPPEYALHGHISVKIDVFSFGVIVLEIVSGKKNSLVNSSGNMEHLLSNAWKFWRKGNTLKLMDPILRGSSRNEIMRCIHIGLLCVQENIAKRPTMDSVVLMLNSETLSLPSPSPPAFFMGGSIEAEAPLLGNISGVTDQSLTHSGNMSINDASITDPYPR